MHAMETINRKTWRKPLSLRGYRTISGAIDAGEDHVLSLSLSENPASRVLDLGVGGGRTADLFRGRVRSYIGIDYTPDMVEAARERHPDLTFYSMDARKLQYDDGVFDLVFFSYNGIDAVDDEGRARVLSEAYRVLAPGGLFVFSTFNRAWFAFAPGHLVFDVPTSANPLRMGLRLARFASGALHARRLRKYEVRAEDHAILLHPAHYYGIMVHATTVAQTRIELKRTGFAPDPLVFDRDAQPLLGEAGEDIQYFHVLSRKPSG